MSRVTCPVCLHEVAWEDAPLVAIGNDGSIAPLVVPQDENAAGKRMLTHTSYRACDGRNPAHYLPADYGDHDVKRITVGIIGKTAAGKTLLLAAMIGQLMRVSRQWRFDLQVDPLDLRIHLRYRDEVLTPFLDRREVLKRTELGATDITDAFLITNLNSGARFAVTFFDVSGELLARAGREEKEFLGAVNALIFVVDPQAIRSLALREAGATEDIGGSEGDQAFDVVLRLLRLAQDERSGFLSIPSATVVAKSDLLMRRGSRIVDRWMRADAGEDMDLSTVEEESEDVFTYLYTKGAERWLEAAQQCAWSTLHFASASGTAPQGERFPDSAFQPRRVIKPLLSLLAMKGVIDPSFLEGTRT